MQKKRPYGQKHLYKGKELTAEQLAKKAKIHVHYVRALLRQGFTPEEIVVKKYKERTSPMNKKDRKIPLFGFKNTYELAESLGMTRQRIYQRYEAGWTLQQKKGKITWTKNNGNKKKD